uniref:MYND-type domain-containing protein n=1 Tax=Chaetoceros debilis TaxID=122233 RepID=A0A7S3Q0B8_9STRA
MSNKKQDQRALTEITKECSQCHKEFPRNGFSNKQWRDATKKSPTCRLCAEYTKISDEKSRPCYDCNCNLPRKEFAIFQWSKGVEARCHSCTDKLSRKVLNSIKLTADGKIAPDKKDGSDSTLRERPDGILVCAHSLECCDICMVDYTLMNDYTRKRTQLGRQELTQEECDAVAKRNMKGSNVRISKKICIMDGLAICPRSSKKMRCPCDEVTYCSAGCQKQHWMIHQMTCKWHAKKEEEKKKAREEKEKHKQRQQVIKEAAEKTAANNLTEQQKNVARMEAFFAENNGGEHSIDECAWQLGEHPLVIGGGSIRYGRNGEEFIKGDVAKIYREKMDIEWDGSPRFGVGPYVQEKHPEDWIAKARRGKSQRMKDVENDLNAMYLNNSK